MSSSKRRKLISGISLLLFLGIMALSSFLFGDDMTAMANDPEAFKERTAGIKGMLFFIVLIALQVVLAVIPGQIFAFAGGYCFGAIGGTLLVLLGTMIGSLFAFLLARWLGTKAVTAFYPEEKLQQLLFLKESPKQYLITFFVFLIPGVPKDMVSYFMGLTQMRLPAFLIISALGRLPAMTLTVLSGAAVQEKSKALTIVVLSLLLALAVAAFIAFVYKRKKEVSQENNDK